MVITMICLPVQGDNQRAIASELSPVQVSKPWYNYLTPRSSVLTLLSMKYAALKFANFSKVGINLVCSAMSVVIYVA